jgi:hypothetical protein
LVDRIRRLRRFNNALPATKPKDLQDTAVIGHNQKAVLPVSSTLGDIVPLMGFNELRVAITRAETKVARNAANAPAFKTAI